MKFKVPKQHKIRSDDILLISLMSSTENLGTGELLIYRLPKDPGQLTFASERLPLFNLVLASTKWLLAQTHSRINSVVVESKTAWKL